MPEEYFEDLEIGDTREFGSYEVTKEEVLEFAEQYDPSRSTSTRSARMSRCSAGSSPPAGTPRR